MKWSLASVAVVALAAVATSQTFIVDTFNGPGTNFTEIATAVAAVPDGAVLRVRTGSYAAFTITNKGLSVVCDSGVTVVGGAAPVTVSGSSLQQTVELRGLQIALGIVLLSGCQGPLRLYDCNAPSLSYPASGGLQVTGCNQFQAVHCTFGDQMQTTDAVVIDGSVGALTNCTVASSLRGINLRSSVLQLIDCAVSSLGFSIPTPAIGMTNGNVRILAGSLYCIWGPCIQGTGTARATPSVAANPGLFLSTLGSIVEMPAVVTTGGSLGTTVTVTMRGPTNSVAALLAGQPGPPLAIPGIADPSWLQPGTEVLCQLSGVPLQIQRPVPNLPSLRGLRIAWQGFTYDAVTGLQASSPAETTVW